MKNCFTSTSFWVNELETTWFYRIWTFWLRKKVFREKRSTIYNYTAFYDPLVSTENRALSRLKLTNTDDNTALLMRSYHHPHMQKISRGEFLHFFFAPKVVSELRTEIRYYFAHHAFLKCAGVKIYTVLCFISNPNASWRINSWCFAFIFEFTCFRCHDSSSSMKRAKQDTKCQIYSVPFKLFPVQSPT